MCVQNILVNYDYYLKKICFYFSPKVSKKIEVVRYLIFHSYSQTPFCLVVLFPVRSFWARGGSRIMVNACEVNAKLGAYMLQQDKRLNRTEDCVAALAANVQTFITALATKVDVFIECTDKGKEVSHQNPESPPPNYMVPRQHGPIHMLIFILQILG